MVEDNEDEANDDVDCGASCSLLALLKRRIGKRCLREEPMPIIRVCRFCRSMPRLAGAMSSPLTSTLSSGDWDPASLDSLEGGWQLASGSAPSPCAIMGSAGPSGVDTAVDIWESEPYFLSCEVVDTTSVSPRPGEEGISMTFSGAGKASAGPGWNSGADVKSVGWDRDRAWDVKIFKGAGNGGVRNGTIEEKGGS